MNVAMNIASAMIQVKFRNNDQAAQVIGRQLALIGDQLHGNRALGRPGNGLLSPFRILRPTLTSALYRDIQKQLCGVQGALYTTLKAWLTSVTPTLGPFRAEALPAWANVGWINRFLLTVALVATGSLCTALWVEWEG
ncbi:unnamed protein product [Boreogadus saida]